ncbi:hypothetical protein JL722_9475 [Aureococcus anophagefferens]|nr:hypothetical protein JL722_9475 [Aureococcus anophagefferens]
MRLRALLATVIFRACTAANSTWTTSGVVEAGHGVGWCLQPSDAGASDWRARVVVRRVATNSSGPRYRLYSARDHVYVLAFALDASRDLAVDGAAAARDPRGGLGADSTLRGDGGRRLVVVATDASTARLRPFLFRSFPPPEADDDDYLVDARSHHCRVVGADGVGAPPFFPVRRFDVDGSPRRLLDGALVANNPTHFALAEASALRRGADRRAEQTLDLVVSLGTGAAPAKARSSAADARSFLGAIPGACPRRATSSRVWRIC